MRIGRIIIWFKKLFGFYNEVEEIDYDLEELPPHVKNFMKKRFDEQ